MQYMDSWFVTIPILTNLYLSVNLLDYLLVLGNYIFYLMKQMLKKALLLLGATSRMKKYNPNGLLKFTLFGVAVIGVCVLQVGVNGTPTVSPTYSPTVSVADAVFCDLAAATTLGTKTDVTGWRCSGGSPVLSVCSTPWTGVTCSSSIVVSLDVSSKSISGTLPTSLGDLNSLTYLALNTIA
jgi:hypothetical protein